MPRHNATRQTLLSIYKGPIVVRRPLPRTMLEIVQEVAEDHEISPADLRYGGRTWAYAHPRQAAMAEMYETGWWSLPEIGRFFGGMHHTTVLHAIRQHAARQALHDAGKAA